MPIVIDLSLTLAWRVTRETTNSIHIYPVHFLVGVAHQWITPKKGNRTRHTQWQSTQIVGYCGLLMALRIPGIATERAATLGTGCLKSVSWTVGVP